MLARAFPFANQLNSMARQAAAERAWASIQRFYDNCKAKVSGKKAKSVGTGVSPSRAPFQDRISSILERSPLG
nr:hypothetical protein [Chamaesiphon sp. OTE_75_metabat_556]